jgi:hypothetical protein
MEIKDKDLARALYLLQELLEDITREVTVETTIGEVIIRPVGSSLVIELDDYRFSVGRVEAPPREDDSYVEWRSLTRYTEGE